MDQDTVPAPSSRCAAITIRFPGVLALDGVDFIAAPRRGARPHGRERRRQVDADQGAHRRLRRSTRGTITVAGEQPGLRQHRRRAARRDLDRLPRGQPLHEPLGRRERHARPRAAQPTAGSTGRPSTSRRHATWRSLGLELDTRSPLSSHSIAVQQLVAISRAMVLDAQVLILDEPTSSLDRDEVERLFAVIRDLRDTGRGHPVRQPLPRPGLRDRRPHHGAAQRQARRRVPRRGPPARRAGDQDDRSRARRPRRRSRRPSERTIDRSRPPVLRATGLGRRGALEPADIDVYEGEVVGIAGLLGSGRTELVRLLYGADRADAGEVEINGRSAAAVLAAPRDRPPDRVLLRGPPGRGHRRRPHRRREHRARHAGPARLAAADPPGRAGRGRRRVHDAPWASGPATRRCSPATSPAATSRRCCSRAGWPPRPSCSSSTSPPAASTSAPRPTSSARSPSSLPRDSPSSSSPPSSRRCFDWPSASS